MHKLNEAAYQKLIDEDIEWLEQFPDSLERQHIELVLRDSVLQHYPPYKPEDIPTLMPVADDSDLHFNCWGETVPPEEEIIDEAGETIPLINVLINHKFFLFPLGYELSYEEILSQIQISKAYVEVQKYGRDKEVLVDHESTIVEYGTIIEVVESEI